ncbi:MAG: glycoside hydrolase family 16 protein [Gammaproteobacteria bacterium]
MLVNAPVSGAEFKTPSQSGLTEAGGQFPYLTGENVTFTVGTISLGTVQAADIITPVELTGSAAPTTAAATNMLVFLQSIDSDSPNYGNGISISAATRAAAEGLTLNFNSPNFDMEVAAVVAVIAPGNVVVSEQTALDNFYLTYVDLGGFTTLGWPFPGYPPFPPPRDSIEDGGFEPPGVPDAIGGNQGACGSGSLGAWEFFNCDFVTSTLGPSSAPVSHDTGGTQSLIQFGVDAGAENAIEALEGDFVDASVWAMSWAPDPFNNLVIVQLTFWDAPGGRLGGGNQVGTAVESFADSLGNQPIQLVPQDGAEVSDWTQMSVSGVAPAGTQSAQILLIHILIDGTPDSGAIYWDDVMLTSTGGTSTEPGFQLVWSDEFDLDGEPSSDWTLETGYGANGWGNDEWQLYTTDPDNVRVENGNLVISAQCGSSTPGGGDGTNTLSNAGFELPDASGSDIDLSCSANTSMPFWTTSNCNFLNSNNNPTEILGPMAHEASQVLKQFGDNALAFQDVPAAPGQMVAAAAWAMNWDGGIPFLPPQETFANRALLQIIFLDLNGDIIGNAVEDSADSSRLTPQDGFEISDWTLMEISAIAPTGTASARIQLKHELSGGSATAPVWWDDASLTVTTPPAECGKRDGTITSARINTSGSFAFTFGKIEARIRVPVGTGAWPAFWMLGANFPEVGWPFSGELDVMEVHNRFSNEYTTHATMHWCDETRQNPATPEVCFPDNEGWIFVTDDLSLFPESLGDDFHVYSAVWDEDRVVASIDGQEYFNLAINPATMDEFLKAFFMILNVAIGGTLGGAPDATTPWPQTMLVDWVRVYQDITQ